jgi:surface antigen Omp85-like protein
MSIRWCLRTCALAAVGVVFIAARATAQQRDDRAAKAESSRVPTGWDIAGVPALNFDADEGFGYGAILELYNYGRGVQPYRYTIQPTVFLTTEGRRDYIVFFDAPTLLPGRWRVSAFAANEQQLAQPYYGIGNDSPHDPNAERGADPYFYRFGRTRWRATADFQHALGHSSARLLLGGGVTHSNIDLTPFDSGTTLLAIQLGNRTPAPSRTNYVRAGLVWDTRDREIGPTRGTWAELLVQNVDRRLGATENFTRWTATAREYAPLSRRLTFAQRFVAQQVLGSATFDELSTIQSSFKQQEGIGGSSSIRGLPKDRYIGKALLLSNSELRWRATEFSFLGRPSFLALSAFADAGRVWSDRLRIDEALQDLHAGYGGGARIGVGPSFVVATDVGHSSESAAAMYIGLGWMF